MASYKLSELKNDPEIYKYHPGAKENVENLILNTEKNYKEFKEFCIDCAMFETEPVILIPSAQSDLRIVFSFTKRIENMTIDFKYIAKSTYIARLAHYEQVYTAILKSTFEHKKLFSATNFSDFSDRFKNWLREE